MSDKDEIKELFQKELGNYEAKVDPSLWQGIQSGISASATAASTSISIGVKVAVGLISAAIITVVSIALYNTTTNNKEKQNQKITENTVKVEDTSIDDKPIVKGKNNNVEDDNSIKEEDSKEVIQLNKYVKEIEEQTNESKSNETLENQEKNKEVDLNRKKTTDNSYQKEEENTTEKENQSSKKISKETTEELFIIPTISKQENQYVVFEIEDSNVDEIVWDFGDGEFSRELKPEHFYTDGGEYNVIVKGYKNKKEVKKSIAVKVHIAGKFTNLPNSLTPNRDNVNDFLYVESEGIKEFQINVMNNKQEVIYQSSDINFRWDGTMNNGMPALEGRYIYIIIAKDEQGNTINKYQQLEIKR